MSSLKIEERIAVSAPPARVWKFLLDPARVAGCLPGAKFDGVEGDNTFLGTMKVKVGPVMMEFKGKATMSEIVESERRVTMTGTGNDKSGGGSAKMDMKSRIVAIDGGGSEIVVVADVDLAGKLVRFGRGMMEGISKQLFKQFSERVRAELENEEDEPEEEAKTQAEEVKAESPAELPAPAPAELMKAGAGVEAPAALPSAESPVPEEKKEAGAGDAEASKEGEAPAKEEAVAKEDVSSKEEASPREDISAKEPQKAEESAPAETNKESPAEEPAAKPADEEKKPAAKPVDEERKPAAEEKKPAGQSTRKAPSGTRKAAPLAVKDNEALDAGSLVWAAIWEWIKGFFRRLFGKTEKSG